MYPKQFLSLLHDETLLQRTLRRLDDIEHAPPVVVCNNEHRFVVAEQARQIGIAIILLILALAACLFLGGEDIVIS